MEDITGPAARKGYCGIPPLTGWERGLDGEESEGLVGEFQRGLTGHSASLVVLHVINQFQNPVCDGDPLCRDPRQDRKAIGEAILSGLSVGGNSRALPRWIRSAAFSGCGQSNGQRRSQDAHVAADIVFGNPHVHVLCPFSVH